MTTQDSLSRPLEVTRLLSAASIAAGTPAARDAAERLLPLVYAELRELARSRLARETPGQTLQATALVHEAYLRLVDSDSQPDWSGRAHFFFAAATAMRRILVERAREKQSLKRGGAGRRVALAESALIGGEVELDHLALEDALERLSRLDQRKSQVVELRYFAGLTIEETAEVIGISPATVKTDWSYARAWLHRELAGE